MPELPEVETIKRGLQTAIKGKKIADINVLNTNSFKGNSKKAIGSSVLEVKRRAKMLIIKLPEDLLLIHLKMSGQLIFQPKNEKPEKLKNKQKVLKLPNKHTRVILKFTDGSKLFFNDIRKFGWIKILSPKDFMLQTKSLGPEPLKKEFTSDYLKQIFTRSQRPIKLMLMDQTKIAGIGNIYASEALFMAGINPEKKVNTLKSKEIKALKKAVVKVLKKGIKYKGSSAQDKTYIQPTGEIGSYQHHFLVYQRNNKKCKICARIIKRIKIGGRSTFYCNNCQT
ncbi:bifunctional DNA-formamidopyrimidine glycosylase/DNA-(apurinic or apyrimidinic site) lyase [Patescibacteria group bacterium]